MARTLEVQRADSAQEIAVAMRFDRGAVEQMFQKALGITKQPAYVKIHTSHGHDLTRTLSRIEGIMYRYRRGEAFSIHLAASVSGNLTLTQFERCF